VTVLVFKPQPQPPARPVAAVEQTEGGGSAATVPAVVGSAPKAERFLEVLLSVAMAMFSWGAYGPVLHRGQAAMEGSRLRPLICIGVAYFLIAVLVPLALLVPMGDTGRGTSAARSGASGPGRSAPWARWARSSPSPAAASRSP
jgi:hypothetical protein